LPTRHLDAESSRIVVKDGTLAFGCSPTTHPSRNEVVRQGYAVALQPVAIETLESCTIPARAGCNPWSPNELLLVVWDS